MIYPINAMDVYIPIDRRHALSRGQFLPDRTHGTALFVDISGFSSLTTVLLNELGMKRGPEELTRHLNRVYEALIYEVHSYGGSVIGFAGDAITCWFDGDGGLRAAACGLAMQQAMAAMATAKTPAGASISLAVKAAIAAGPARRFLVGDPGIRRIDVLAGATIERMAAAEQVASSGDVVVAPELVQQLGDVLTIAEVRSHPATSARFAVVAALTGSVDRVPWPAVDPPLTLPQVKPWLHPPIYRRLANGHGRFLTEIRQVTALFIRFGGLDFDADDQAGEKLDAFVRWVQAIIAENEGILVQLTIGDKGCYMYAAFGAPVTHGDDSARAAATALRLLALPEQLRFVGPVQMGISQGRMRTGTYGGSTRLTYGVLGDEVNLAARLMSQAEPGQILVSQRIAAALAGKYVVHGQTPVRVKGRTGPVPVAVLDPAHANPILSPLDADGTALVGREAELAQLEAWLALAEAGRSPHIIRVTGAAGVGKTHLVAVLAGRARTQGWLAAGGACHSVTQGMPYHPWQGVLPSLLDVSDSPAGKRDSAAAGAGQIERVRTALRSLNPAWEPRLPLLGDLLHLPIPDNDMTAEFDPKLRRESLFALVADIIRHLAANRPLLILIEDVHWLDEASRELLLTLGRDLTDIPLVLLLTERLQSHVLAGALAELAAHPQHHRLLLPELADEMAARLIEQRLDGPAAPLLVALFQARARGNPFFIQELVDALRERGDISPNQAGVWQLSGEFFQMLRRGNCLKKEPAGWRLLPGVPLPGALDLPDTVYAAVQLRLDHLPADRQRTLLKLASVIGRQFDVDLLRQIYEPTTAAETLAQELDLLVQRDLLRPNPDAPDAVYQFKHAIIQEVAYQTLPERDQRRLHQGVGQAIEALAPEAVEQLAYHFSRSEQRHKSLHYLDLAARKARRDDANETALIYYDQALALEQRWPWLLGKTEVLHVLSQREEEAATLALLAQAADAPAHEVAFRHGKYYELTGEFAPAQTHYARALAAARDRGDLLEEARCAAQLGFVTWKRGRYALALDWYRQALQTLENEALPSGRQSLILAETLNGQGTVYRQQGALAEARRCYERALEICRQDNHKREAGRALDNLGSAAFHGGSLAEAKDFHRQALDLRREIGDRTGEGISLYNLALATRRAGDYGQARDLLLEVLHIHRATNNRWEEVNVWNELGIFYQELGQWADARHCLEQGLQVARMIEDEEGAGYLLSNLGLVLRDQDELAAAERCLQDGLEIMQALRNDSQAAYFWSYLATVSLQAGHISQAIERAERAVAIRRRLGLRQQLSYDLATLAAAHLAAGDLEQAITYARQTLEILDESPGEGPELPQRDYFICFQVLAAVGSAIEAEIALRAAYNLVLTRANHINDPDLRQSFLTQAPVNRQIVAAAGHYPFSVRVTL